MLMKAQPDARLPRLTDVRLDTPEQPTTKAAPATRRLPLGWAIAMPIALIAMDLLVAETTPQEMFDMDAPLYADIGGWVAFGLFLGVLGGAATRRLGAAKLFGGFAAIGGLLHLSCGLDGHVSLADGFYAVQSVTQRHLFRPSASSVARSSG